MATWTELSKYKHHAVRSDGAKFLDGVRDDSLNTSWLTVNSAGRVTLAPGLYDELLVVKGEVSDEQIKAWASMGAPFYDPTPVIPDEQIPSAQEWNGKARTYYQPTPPVATAVGDLWVDTDDNDRLYRWDGATWVDITDKSPVDAEKKPVYVKGAGADIDIDKFGIRATRKADGKKTFEIDAETGDARFAADISGSSGTFADGRVVIGDIGGKPWGEGSLPTGTVGLWGDQAGVYLQGYTSLIQIGEATDEEVLDFTHLDLINPRMLVIPKDFTTYLPTKSDQQFGMYNDARKIPGQNIWRIKAKGVLQGHQFYLTPQSNAMDAPGSYVQPTVGGVEGTEFFASVVIHWPTPGSYKVSFQLTNQFDDSGNPINWVEHDFFSGATTQELDPSGRLIFSRIFRVTVPKGTYAIRVQVSGEGNPKVPNPRIRVYDIGYKSEAFVSRGGDVIAENQPSGFNVTYFLVDQG